MLSKNSIQSNFMLPIYMAQPLAGAILRAKRVCEQSNTCCLPHCFSIAPYGYMTALTPPELKEMAHCRLFTHWHVKRSYNWY
jgi:hypothetical protein